MFCGIRTCGFLLVIVCLGFLLVFCVELFPLVCDFDYCGVRLGTLLIVLLPYGFALDGLVVSLDFDFR